MIDFDNLDRMIHEKGRLAIMTLLASRSRAWSFQDMKSELGLSDGNLITHLRALEGVNYVASEKLTGEGRPQTNYHLSKEGKDAFEKYISFLESIIEQRKNL